MTYDKAIRVYGALYPPKKKGDAGYDLAILHPLTIHVGQSKIMMTDVQIEMPEGMCALVVPRSSLNKIGIFCQIGLIDSGYRGQVGVVLYNSTQRSYRIEAGDRIAQLLFLPFLLPELTSVAAPDDLAASERGSDGFGSTGKGKIIMTQPFDPRHVAMPVPEGAPSDADILKTIDQVKLCLSIMSGRRNILAFSPEEFKLIGVDFPINRAEDEHAALEIIEVIMAEVIFALLPAPAQPVDLQRVAVALLKRIEQEGGVMLRTDILMPDDLINQLENEGILSHGDGGIRWGRFAQQAMTDVEAEYGSISDD